MDETETREAKPTVRGLPGRASRAARAFADAIRWRLAADSRDDRWSRATRTPSEPIGTMLCNDVVLAVARMKFRRLAEESRPRKQRAGDR
jgi:hypothetical protein